MVKIKKVMTDLWTLYNIEIISIVAMYIMIYLLPNKNILTINLSILSIIYINLVYKKVFEIKKWFKTTWQTIIWVSIFYYTILFLGAYGVIGALLIIVGFAVYKIYKGRKLYGYITSWGASVLKGSKEEFDLKKIGEDKK